MKMDKIKIMLEYVRNIFLALIIFFTIVPNEFKKVVIVLVLIWGSLELILDRKFFCKFFLEPSKLMYIIYATCIFFTILSVLTNLSIDLLTLFGVYVASIIYIYCKKSGNSMGIKFIVCSALISMILTNIITFIALEQNTDICRILATTKGNLLYGSKAFGIASYSLIYSYVFVEIILFYFIIRCKSSRFIKLASIIILLFNLIILLKAKFVISYILLAMGIVLVLLKIDSLKKFLLLFLISLIIIISILPFIQQGCEWIAQKVNSDILKSRFSEISLMLENKNIENTEDIKARINVYQKSLQIFIQNPLTGLVFEADPESAIGGHSTIFDMLAKYGIIGLGILLANVVVIFNSIFDSKNRKAYMVLIFVLVAQALINNIILVPMACVIFTILPCFTSAFFKEESK